MKKPDFRLLFILFGTILLAGCSHAPVSKNTVSEIVAKSSPLKSNLELARKILKLDPSHLSETDVHDVLSQAPAPRVFCFNGSVPIVTMDPFAKFLAGLGYPEASLADPENGKHSYTSHGSVGPITDKVLAASRENGMSPILIGHSQGGAMVVRILHELQKRKSDEKISFAAAIGTGKFMRALLGQWNTLRILREIPDTAENFSGYQLSGDIIGSDMPLLAPAGEYKPTGNAHVRNVHVAKGSHLRIPVTDHLAADPVTRSWVQNYVRSSEEWPAEPNLRANTENLLFAADIWYDIKKNWCLELQNWIRTHMPETASQ